MTTIHHPLTPADATVVASLRQAMSAQKGKYMGTGARQPFEAQKNGVHPADCQTTPGVVGGVSGWWCHPANPRPDAALIYYHGGWYMLGTAESFRNYQTIHVGGDHGKIPNYFSGDQCIRHEPGVRDGVAAFKRDLAELVKHRSIDEIKFVLGQGDFVFIAAKGSHELAP